MFKFKSFVGIDISKKTFDAALIFQEPGTFIHRCFPQTREGFTGFVKWLNAQQVALQDTLICMKHTGLYTNGITRFLVEAKAHVRVEMAIKIKLSMGFCKEYR